MKTFTNLMTLLKDVFYPKEHLSIVCPSSMLLTFFLEEERYILTSFTQQ